MVFGLEELEQIEEILRLKLQEDLVGILSKLNREEKLEEFCRMIGIEEALGKKERLYQSLKSGIIVVVGESQIPEKIMQGILKKFGISKDRLECHLGYHEAKSFAYRKLQFQPKYSLILVGSMGHKAENIGDHSSAISMMEHEEGYPPVIRLGCNELKITKSSFQEAIEKALSKGLLQTD